MPRMPRMPRHPSTIPSRWKQRRQERCQERRQGERVCDLRSAHRAIAKRRRRLDFGQENVENEEKEKGVRGAHYSPRHAMASCCWLLAAAGPTDWLLPAVCSLQPRRGVWSCRCTIWHPCL